MANDTLPEEWEVLREWLPEDIDARARHHAPFKRLRKAQGWLQDLCPSSTEPRIRAPARSSEPVDACDVEDKPMPTIKASTASRTPRLSLQY